MRTCACKHASAERAMMPSATQVIMQTNLKSQGVLVEGRVDGAVRTASASASVTGTNAHMHRMYACMCIRTQEEILAQGSQAPHACRHPYNQCAAATGAHMHMHTYIRMQARTHVRTHACTQVLVYVHTLTCTHRRRRSTDGGAIVRATTAVLKRVLPTLLIVANTTTLLSGQHW